MKAPWRVTARLCFVAALLAMFMAACDGSDSGGPDGGGGGRDGGGGGRDGGGGTGGDGGGGGGGGGSTPSITISNGARLAWSQSAASPQAVQSLTFLLYVDGNASMRMSEISCGSTPTVTGYDCSGRLPNMSAGDHVLQLAAVSNGQESPRSLQLRVTVRATLLAANPLTSDPLPAPPTVVCVANSRECYDATLIASGVAPPLTLSSASDGRLLFVDGGRSIRVVDGDTLISTPALVPEDPNGRIVGLAVSDAEGDARTVFVAWTEIGAAGGPQLNITRYRDVDNTLGEGATIVSGLPFAPDALAPLAVDRAGLLYVAMPAVGAGAPANTRSASEAGTVLRFTRDGLVPSANPRASPIIAEGYSRPTVLTIDPERNRAWIGGDQPWPYDVATFLIPTGEPSAWPVRPQPALQSPRGVVRRAAPTTLTFGREIGSGKPTSLIVGGSEQLFRAAVSRDGRLEALGAMRFDPAMSVRAATPGLNGSWYVAAGSTDASLSILHLTRR